jgi:hypothetical protein
MVVVISMDMKYQWKKAEIVCEIRGSRGGLYDDGCNLEIVYLLHNICSTPM